MDLKLLPGITSPDELKALPVSQLPQLAAEIRHAICDQIKRSGGHFAPNLGVVELTIALHYVFDFGHDRLLFDVGHQCYPHKLVTGRYGMLGKLRQRGGMAGFPDPRESNFDLFSVGHAGTAISTAVGMARGDTLSGEAFAPEKNTDGRRVVALVGDASIVNGVAMEGLNNAGTLKRQMLVVLNDNGMSIAKPQGAVAAYFDRIRVNRAYRSVKRAAKDVVSHLPGGSLIGEMYHRMGEVAKDLLVEDAWFEKFGLLTLGPVDGHDLPSLIDVLLEVKDFDRPLVLHVHTVKGKGYEFSENDATTFHSPKPFAVQGCRVELKSGGRSFTAAFSDALEDVMERDSRAVACTAAMPDGTGLKTILERFPKRSWDTGICESHAMDMMAGLAKTGFKPFFAVYSTFLQRAFDQAFQEVALQGLPVRLCLDRAGLVGGDGAVHHGFCDISLLRVFPDAALVSAMDEPSLVAALEFMRCYDTGLSCVRYPRDSVSDRFTDAECPPFELGKARPLLENDDAEIALFAYGTMAISAMEAADMLADDVPVSVYDARFARPVDIDLLESLLRRGVRIVTIEDHGLEGGFGSCVIDACHERGLDTRLINTLGIPCSWIYQGSRDDQLEEAGLDVPNIIRTVRAMASVAPEVNVVGDDRRKSRHDAGATVELNVPMTPDDARALMEMWTDSPALRVHMECVAACMGAYADQLEPAERERWIVAGLLHDMDYEKHPTPEEHPFIGVKHLRERGDVDDEIIDAILGHAEYSGVERKTPMAKSLFAVDELAGFIVACSKVRPNGIEDLQPKSVKKKLKDKAFAAAVNRAEIATGIADLGVDTTEHVQRCIDALRGERERLGL